MSINSIPHINQPVSKLAAVEKVVGNFIVKPNIKPDFDAALVSILLPNSPQAESIRSLRSQLLLRWFNVGNKSLAIVGANLGEGCSFVAANLAVTFAQLGMRTLLIDTDLREPRVHHIFKLKNDVGLSDILSGKTGQVIINPLESIENLSILSAGATQLNAQELLSGAGFGELLTQTTEQYDVVLVDTAPAILSADAQAAASVCAGALLVSHLNHTKHTQLIEMRDLIAVTNAKIVGSVINDF